MSGPEPAAIPKPGPALEGLTAEFYEFCAAGELRFQCCDGCGTWRHPPRVRCARCGSDRWTWTRSSGRGTVFTWTTVHQAMHPAFAPDVPYVVAVVETDEGVRIVTNLRGVEPDAVRLGLPVGVEFEDRDGVTLPQFRGGG
ncbi:MAG TPA: Zn-ribbon domain-containing OB-fold protein [Acidimicrobiia bacterium]|nr:Zn-ribbon domain-containing OB-fold protein [Acidimicrobiia bacterium]